MGGKRGPHGHDGATAPDGGERVNGSKCHLIVDTQGLVLGCLVAPANVDDHEGARTLIRRLWLKYPDLHVFADGGYDSPVVAWASTATATCWRS